MKILVLSDLHIEGCKFDPITGVEADVIVLAGDIAKGANGISWASEAFKGMHIIYVPGNHEYYGRDIHETQALMRIMAHETGVHLLDNGVAIIDGVRFIGTTLWTDFFLYCTNDNQPDERKLFRSMAMMDGQRYLNDFKVIHFGRLGHFSPTHSIELHEKSLAWLIGKLDEPFDGKTVVVTHHLPSRKSVAERFDGELLSACFASNLDYLFGKMNLWIHGHTHDNFDYVSDGTRVICNPRGYMRYTGAENFDFNPKLVIEI